MTPHELTNGTGTDAGERVAAVRAGDMSDEDFEAQLSSIQARFDAEEREREARRRESGRMRPLWWADQD